MVQYSEPKPVTSQKKIVQYSNKAKTCHQSEKDGAILKQSQNLSPVRKRCEILKQSHNLSTVKTRWCNSQTEQTCHQSEKDGTIFKQSQNLSPVRKRWYNTQTETKPVTNQKRWYNTQTQPKPGKSQKKMVQYSDRAKTCHQSENMVQYSSKAKTCHQSEKDGTILKQSQNLSPVRKRWYNTQTETKPVTSQKR